MKNSQKLLKYKILIKHPLIIFYLFFLKNARNYTFNTKLLYQTKSRNLVSSKASDLEKEFPYDKNKFNWKKNARPNQLLPAGKWLNWLILAGRGFGKTRTGSETIRHLVDSKQSTRVALIGKTIEEAKGIMVEGVSGILSVYPPDDQNFPKFESYKRRIIWPNGAKAYIYGADRYDCLRGPQFDLAWMDEFAKFKYPEKIYEQLMMCLRIGENPRCLITTTPRPLNILKDIVEDKHTVLTTGTTFDNSENLSKSFLNYVEKKYGSSQLGRQELYADLLFEEKDSLWSRNLIKYKMPEMDLVKIVVAIDPAVTYTENSDETGIIVVGKTGTGKGYVLADESGKYRPNEWGEKIVKLFHKYKADRVVAEVNQGGDLVAEMLRTFDSHIPYSAVRATRGKFIRAEPIAALYEQNKIFHIHPFPKLEEQMCNYVPGKKSKSPDRMDALVWGMSELFKPELENNVKIWS